MLCGFDDDLAKQATAASNRIRGLLTQIHPALERVIGPHLDHPAMPEQLIKYPSPQALSKTGQSRIATLLAKLPPRAGKRWAAEVFTALGEQSVLVAGSGAAGIVLAQLTAMLKQLRTAREELLTQVEALVEAHAPHLVMPAVGVRTEARIITEVAGKEFQSSGHLASYAGLPLVTWRSGTSIRGDHSSKKGNKNPKTFIIPVGVRFVE